MSKLAHSHQPSMDLIEARALDEDGIESIDDEATRFAAALLIPEKFILMDLARLKGLDIDDDRWLKKLAQRYRVSPGLMLYRLRQLRPTESAPT